MDQRGTALHDERSEHVVLAGDVGGTFVRLVLARNGALLGVPQQLARERFTDLADACGDFLDRHAAGLRVDGVSLGAAGRLQQGQIALTNGNWLIDPQALADALGLRPGRVHLLNDFAALAWALPTLQSDELIAAPGSAAALAGRGRPPGLADGNRVVVGPGTGLGVAAMIRSAGRWHPLATEGGHVTFAPETPFESAAAQLASARFGHVSWERILSGPGLALLRDAALIEAGMTPDTVDSAMVIETIGRADAASIKAARSFIDLLGAFAGDLALLYEAPACPSVAARGPANPLRGQGPLPRLARRRAARSDGLALGGIAGRGRGLSRLTITRTEKPYRLIGCAPDGMGESPRRRPCVRDPYW